MKRGKKYRNAEAKLEEGKFYPLDEACGLVKETSYTKFDATIELHVNLGVDPRKQDQQVRGTVVLPHGTGKKVRIAVVASPDKIQEAKDAGAEHVGGPELVDKIAAEEWFEFDKLIASPDMMRHIGRIGKLLGPRGLMPNPKVGTVTPNIGETVKALKGGQVEYRLDKFGIVHVPAGKASFEKAKLYENTLALLNALVKAKPAAAKGIYIQSVTLAATMGPGVPVDVNAVRATIDEARKTA